MGAARPGYILILVLWSLAADRRGGRGLRERARTSISQAVADVERATRTTPRAACIQTAKDLSIGVRRAQLGTSVSRVAGRDEHRRRQPDRRRADRQCRSSRPRWRVRAGSWAIARKLDQLQGGQRRHRNSSRATAGRLVARPASGAGGGARAGAEREGGAGRRTSRARPGAARWCRRASARWSSRACASRSGSRASRAN